MITFNFLDETMGEKYLSFLNELDAQSRYMHYRPGERAMTLQGMVSRIKKQKKQGNCFTVLAMDEETIAGYFSVNGGSSLATMHSASVAIGILEKYRGNGIAKELLSCAEISALNCKIIRFQCSVVAINTPARGFYLSHGFSRVGYLTASFRGENGVYQNELVLEKFLIDMEV